MERFNADVGAVQTTLQKAPEVLHRVRMDIAVHVLGGMVHNFMLELWRQTAAATGRMRRGFVIAHSCGLALVHPSESGEFGVTEHGADEDIRQGWLVTHTSSGKGFGLTLSFKRATDALLLAASFAVDWTQDADTLKADPEFRRAGYSVQAQFSSGHEKESAKQKLADLERAA